MMVSVGGGIAYSMAGSRGVNTGVTRDYRSYYEMLMQGLIATWPSSAEKEKELLDNFLGMFNEEFDKAIAQIEEEAKEESEEEKSSDEEEEETISLARYSRLYHLSHMFRRLCFAIDQVDMSSELDQRLLEHFAEDEHYTDTLRDHYTKLGTELAPKLAQAIEEDESEKYPEDLTRVETELRRAIDGPQLEKLVRIGRIVDYPEPLDRLFRELLRKENYEVLRYASVALDDANYTRILNTAVPMFQEEPAHLMRFLLNHPNFLLEIEERLGVSVAVLDESFLRNPEVQTEVQRSGFLGPAGLWFYVNKRGNPDEMVMILEHLVKGVRANQFSMALDLFAIHAQLLENPLSEELRERVKEATKELLQKVDMQDEFMQSYAMSMIYNFKVAPENVEMFFEIVDHFYSFVPGGDEASSVLRNFYEGKIDEAYSSVVEIYRENANIGFYAGDPLYTVFKEQYRNSLQQIREGTIDDVELAKWFLKSSTRTYEDWDVLPDPEERLSLLTSLFERFSDDKELALLILGGKAALNAIKGTQLDGLLSHMQDYYEIDSSEESIRMAYYLTAIQEEMYDQALAIALDGGPDLRMPAIREGILTRNDSAQPYDYFDPAAILSIVRGNDPFNRAMRSGMMPVGLESMISRIQERVAEESLNEDEVKNMLRSLWRGVQAASIGDAASGFYGMRNFLPVLLQWPSTGSPSSDMMYLSMGVIISGFPTEEETDEEEQEPTLLEFLASKAPLGEELELLLTSVSQNEQLRWEPMKDLVSKAYREFPENLTRRIDELSHKVVGGVASDVEFSLWMRLVMDSDASLSVEESESFVSRARDMKSPNNQQLSDFAALLSKQGHFDQATDCYELLVIRRANLNEFAPSGRIYYYGPSEGEASGVLQLIEEAAKHLPEEKLQTFVRRVVEVVRPLGDTPEFRSTWEAFSIRAFSTAYEPSEVLTNLKELIPDVDRMDDSVMGLDGIRLVELVRLNHLTGNARLANQLTRTLFTTESARSSTELTKPVSVNPRMIGLGSNYQTLSNVQSLATLLGLQMPGMGSSPIVVSTPSIPTSADLFISLLGQALNFEDSKGIDSTAGAFLDWLDDDEIETYPVLNGLTKLVTVLIAKNELDLAQEIASRVQNWLLTKSIEQIDTGLVRSIALMGLEGDLPIASEICGIVFDRGLLDVEQELEFLELIQQQLEAADLLSAVKRVNVETAGLGLLRKLRPIADSANDDDFLQKIETRILTLENSYESVDIAGGLDAVESS
ncbi:MAG: hypothetical protein OXG24_13600 [Gammaproteobacteria bacterium]|nr:hypothetical protein [Gammaproteobacteria bacterium]